MLHALILAQAVSVASPSPAPHVTFAPPGCQSVTVPTIVVPADRRISYQPSEPGVIIAVTFYDRRGCQLGSTTYAKTLQGFQAPPGAIVYQVGILSANKPKIPAGVAPTARPTHAKAGAEQHKVNFAEGTVLR